MNIKNILTILVIFLLASCTEERVNPNISDELIFCTQDAMQCPDGSWVGRSGPNCEFICG